LAELHQIRTFIAAAHALVRGGWVQNGWFAHRTERDELRATTGWNAYRNNGRPVAGACLVGAITHAGGGLATVDGQPTQRTFDLTWHTLFGDRGRPVRYCPAPAVRAAHLRDLIQPGPQRLRVSAAAEPPPRARARGDTAFCEWQEAECIDPGAQRCSSRSTCEVMPPHLGGPTIRG
jgi:hypothetical protein